MNVLAHGLCQLLYIVNEGLHDGNILQSSSAIVVAKRKANNSQVTHYGTCHKLLTESCRFAGRFSANLRAAKCGWP